MASLAKFQTLEEAFLYCRDMDASLAERLEAFSLATRYLLPGYQEAVDSMAARLKFHEAGRAAPKIGDLMPRFVLPDENGELLSLEQLIEKGPVAIVFHRGHWCPYCRINTRALAEVQEQIVGEGGQLTAITPERQRFAAELKRGSDAKFPVLTDIDNGYALSLNLAIWVGQEMEQILAAADLHLPAYQGNEAWLLPIPATFVVDKDGYVAARFVDPDYRNRMAVGELLAALKTALRAAAYQS
jgi:peroxiredoxin